MDEGSLFDKMDGVPERAATSQVTIGDEVVVKKLPQDFIQLQRYHGGWSNGMVECLCDKGIVVDIDPDGDARVLYESGNRWCLDPNALTVTRTEWSSEMPIDFTQKTVVQTSLYAVGDKVKILSHRPVFKLLQSGRGGWIPSMNHILGMIGTVQGIHELGYVEVLVGVTTWKLNPLCLATFKEGTPDCDMILKQVEIRFAPYTALFDKDTDSEDNSDEGESEANIHADTLPLKMAKLFPHYSEQKTKLDLGRAGEKVKVELTLEEFKIKQTDYGEYDSAMIECLHNTGTIIGTEDSGAVLVRYNSGHRFRLNPLSLTVILTESANASSLFQADENTLVEENKIPVSLLNSSQIQKGQIVCVTLAIDEVKKLQLGHGGWCDAMLECLVVPGFVLIVSPNKDVGVRYLSGNMFHLNPQVLQQLEEDKVDDFKATARVGYPFASGDTVKLSDEIGVVKILQDGKGGWKNSLNDVLTETGRVIGRDPRGTVRAVFGVRQYDFNPLNLVKIRPEDPETTNTINSQLRGVVELIKPMTVFLHDDDDDNDDTQSSADESSAEPEENDWIRLIKTSVQLFRDMFSPPTVSTFST